MVEGPEIAAMRHFLNLATEGKRRGCSSGETAAKKLAEAIMLHAALLDDSARSGAQKFMEFYTYAPTTARQLLKEWRIR